MLIWQARTTTASDNQITVVLKRWSGMCGLTCDNFIIVGHKPV